MSGPNDPAERARWEEFVTADTVRTDTRVRAHPRRGTRGVREHSRRVARLEDRLHLATQDEAFYRQRLSASTNDADREYYNERMNNAHVDAALARIALEREL